METYTDEIRWDNYFHDIFEADLDGHGTREGEVRGYINTGAGKGRGVEEYSAIGQQCYPYEGRIEIDESTIEFVDFTPNEPDE